MHQPDSPATSEDAMEDDAIRVILVDAHPLLRQAVRAAMEAEDDIVVVGEAAHADAAIHDAGNRRPDVVVIDDTDAARTTAAVRSRAPDANVVVLATADDAAPLLDVLEAGASGYVTQASGLSDLIDVTRAVARGETAIPRSLVGPVLRELLDRRRGELAAYERLSRLTPRERQVLEMVAAGSNNMGIADALTISPQTARTHVQNVLTKLGVHSRLEAAALVRRHNLPVGTSTPSDGGEGDRPRPSRGSSAGPPP